jgi:hypothetical protein
MLAAQQRYKALRAYFAEEFSPEEAPDTLRL